MLVRHLRDEFGPYGTIVATGPDSIGVCICREGEIFTKKRGREIAEGRAEIIKIEDFLNRKKVNPKTGVEEPSIPNRLLVVDCEIVSLSEEVEFAVKQMKLRAEKYFQPEYDVSRKRAENKLVEAQN